MKVLFAESHNLDRPEPLGSHQYIRLFKRDGHECLWLGPLISPLHIFKPDRLNRRRFKIWSEGVRKVDGIDWLIPMSPFIYYNLPLLRSLYAGRSQYRFCLPPLRKQLERAGFAQADLLWCAGPSAVGLLDLVPHRLSCYRLADRLEQFRRIPPNVRVLQEKLIERAGFVLATSRSLWDWARRVRKEGVYYLPNAVSEIFFEPAANRPADFPDDGRPVAVYVGTINTRFDLEKLACGVRQLKDLHFLIIGPVTFEKLKPGLRSLQAENNFTWLGPKLQAEIPAYLQSSKVGIIPFHVNEQTEAVNPLKYYEYLASGLPVVAPPLRELTAMQGPLYSYGSADEFCGALREAASRREEEKNGLVRFARGHTWENRYRQIMEIVDARLPGGAGGG